MTNPLHISFLHNSGTVLQTSDGKNVEVWELRHTNNNTVLTAWAKHFREHYCSDSEIDSMRNGPRLSRKNYLLNIKFPDRQQAPGPSVRSGDFGEILVSDFLEFILNYEVLSRRTRYSNKTNRNESTKGSDVIGFRFADQTYTNPADELAIFEAKAKFTGEAVKSENGTISTRLQDAIDDSGKDRLRIAESLNAMKQRFFDKGMTDEVFKIERFESEADNPYRTAYGAVALVCNSNYSNAIAGDANTGSHPNNTTLRLIIIKGADMMNLVHNLYQRAADEA
ncbi:MAG: DUF1837 domain-containing protein [Endomicrobia bacterium]|nr:DUF1837 domain-containing protein [Endomicrobiia bacterium]